VFEDTQLEKAMGYIRQQLQSPVDLAAKDADTNEESVEDNASEGTDQSDASTDP
jgi:hypothetical protein